MRLRNGSRWSEERSRDPAHVLCKLDRQIRVSMLSTHSIKSEEVTLLMSTLAVLMEWWMEVLPLVLVVLSQLNSTHGDSFKGDLLSSPSPSAVKAFPNSPMTGK